MRTQSSSPVRLKRLPLKKLLSALGPLLMLAIHVILVTFVLGGGNASAGATGTEIDETTSLRLASTGLITSPLTAFASARLRISEQGVTNFAVGAHVESGGLRGSGLYALWIVDPEDNALLVDTARADEECEVDPNTKEESDCDVVVDLRGHLAEAPFNITTLEGLTINIRELEASGDVLASVTVAASMITSSTTTSAM